MFSINGKISPRQVKRLVILDFFGKGAILLPGFAGNLGSRGFFLSLLLCLGLLILYACLLTRVAEGIQTNFYEYLKECLGKGTGFVLCFFFLAYAVFNLVYLTRAFQTLGNQFILPEERGGTLMILVLLAAFYVAIGGLEVRGRVAEVFYPALFYPLVFLIIFSAFHIRPDYVSGAEGGVTEFSALGSLKMLGAFGGVSYFLFIAPRVDSRKEGGRALVKGIAVTAITLASLFLVVIGAFGEGGLSKTPWPAVTLMSSAEIPGGFLERWDVIFTGLLMTGFFVGAGASLYYVVLVGRTLFPKIPRTALAVGGAGIAFLLALWCGGYQETVKVYTTVNCLVTVPVETALVIVLSCIERKKRRREA